MKRLFMFLTCILCVILCISCAKQDTPKPDDETTGNEQQTTGADVVEEPKHKLTINPDDYYFCKTFELPENFRDAAVENMLKEANLKWTASKDFDVIMPNNPSANQFGINLHFEEGKEYIGLPYANTRVCINEFDYIFVDGKYSSESSSWEQVAGSQCVSAIMSPIQSFTTLDGWSYDFWVGSKDPKIIPVGDYTYAEGMLTKEICETNGLEVMGEAYSKLDKGDIIQSYNQFNHSRLLMEKPNIVKSANGKINLRRSTVKTIEQTNMFDKINPDRSNSTYWVGHTYTFQELFETTYVPITLKEYLTGETEIPYIAMKEELNTAVLAKGTIPGEIESNYALWFVKYDIKNQNGDVVKTYTARNMFNKHKIANRTYSYDLFNNLESGSYTLVITASTAQYKTQVCEVQFEYNK